MQKRKIIPSFLTSMNLMCGFVAILVNEPIISFYLVLVGIAFKHYLVRGTIGGYHSGLEKIIHKRVKHFKILLSKLILYMSNDDTSLLSKS